MSNLTVLIVDDEKLARVRLCSLLRETKIISIDKLHEASSVLEAKHLIGRFKFDCVLLDINMPGPNGFALLEALNDPPLIIFTTAYQNFAVKAFEVNALDYLLKPIGKNRFEIAMRRLVQALDVSNSQVIHNIPRTRLINEIIKVKTKNKVRFPGLNEILFIESKDKFVRFIMTNGEALETRNSLNNLAETLPSNFIRIHRSYIINMSFIFEVTKRVNALPIIQVLGIKSHEIPVGRQYYPNIKPFIED